ncbi:solute carrier family 12 member 2-like, partial [Actinia tenebrosa]|uniref:Solute carrier family 12 member 2-like n=1 Tax=Actinia tenebrosa TaxID=6105 RepID=A0A6P8I511_ACTTE
FQQVNWGSSTQAYTYIRALRFAYRLARVEDHVKNFRPQCLVLTGAPSSRPNLTYIVSQMTRNVGLMICGQVKVGKFCKPSAYENRWLRKQKIHAFHTICTAPTLREGVQSLLQIAGIGKLKPNTLVLGFKNNWIRAPPSEIAEYVNIINDAFEMNYGVAILRMSEEYQMEEEECDDDDWMGDKEEERFLPKTRNLSGSKDSLSIRPESPSHGSQVFSDKPQDASRKIFHVERTATPESSSLLAEIFDSIGDDAEGKQKQSNDDKKEFVVAKNVDLNSDKKDTSSVSDSAAPTSELDFPSGSTKVEVGSLATREFSVSEFRTSDSNISQTLTVEIEKTKEVSSKQSPSLSPSHETSVDPLPVRQEPVMEYSPSSPVSFQGKQRGTIDVWWLSDDGGLTILIPYLLSLHHSWKNCKLRIFTHATSGNIQDNIVRMANLLKKFRIDFSSIEEVKGIREPPSKESVEEFLKLPIRSEFEEGGMQMDKRILRHIRIGELVRKHSKDARLIVMTLPVPKVEIMSCMMYMSWLEVLSADLPPVLLVRGNQTSVLTFYS